MYPPSTLQERQYLLLVTCDKSTTSSSCSRCMCLRVLPFMWSPSEHHRLANLRYFRTTISCPTLYVLALLLLRASALVHARHTSTRLCVTHHTSWHGSSLHLPFCRASANSSIGTRNVLDVSSHVAATSALTANKLYSMAGHSGMTLALHFYTQVVVLTVLYCNSRFTR